MWMEWRRRRWWLQLLHGDGCSLGRPPTEKKVALVILANMRCELTMKLSYRLGSKSCL